MKRTIGLPRALLYYRYDTLWHTFFERLGYDVVVSEPTTRITMERGAALAIDETCLSARIYLGHVAELIGKCDMIFAPRIADFGKLRYMCTRFEAQPDLVRTIFRHSGQRFVDMNIDVIDGLKEEQAYIQLGEQLGATAKEAKRAYKEAVKADERQRMQLIKEEESLYKKDGIRIMMAAHSYVYGDAWIGKPVEEFLKKSGVSVVHADVVNRADALRRSREISPTCCWQMSREILGGIGLHADKVDGVILMSAFPCGPDAMVNEMIQRKFRGLPMLMMTLDGQSGTAGQETRLQSFVDILRFKEGTL